MAGWYLGNAVGTGDGCMTKEYVPRSSLHSLRHVLSLRLFCDLFFWQGKGFLANPNTVDLLRLCPIQVGSTICAGLTANPCQGAPQLAQFVTLGMVNASHLKNVVGGGRNVKMVQALIPCEASDRIQTCLAVAFDQWHPVPELYKGMLSQVSLRGFEFSTRGKCACFDHMCNLSFD